MSEDEGSAELQKGGALIRQAFHIDPYKLDDGTFAQLLGEALWLKQLEKQMMEGAMEIAVLKSLAKAFGGK